MPIRECRPSEEVCDIGKPCGILSRKVDGNDVLEVYDSAQKAVELCRKGNGPVFIECVTYRLRGHVGPDDNIQGSHTDIRPEEEVETWRKKDPLIRFENTLLKNGVLKEEDIKKMKGEAEQEVNEAHSFAEKSPYPKESELSAYVFKQ
jgi:pyruvate dehydrogenase E1 component alpha subunit